jgi:hypothetical protein
MTGSTRRSRMRVAITGGGGGGIRTPDTGIMIPLLYQLSYTAVNGAIGVMAGRKT